MAAIDALTEEVATNLEEVAEVTRRISSKGVGIFLGGVVVGVAVGFYIGHRWNSEKIKSEAFKESAEEIEKMRDLYVAKVIAAQEKPAAEEIIAERGYGAISTPSKSGARTKRPTRPPVPVEEPTSPESIPVDVWVWDYAKELANRTAEEPYVVHKDEYGSSETGYEQKTFTYYDEDGVLVDDTERPLPHADLVVGLDNLKWGHGSDDENVVFVRNEHMEMEMEIIRSLSSYEREVLGLDNDQSN